MSSRSLPSVVGLVGGSGGNKLMTGLRRHPVRPVAICTVCDNGGSTGRILAEMKGKNIAMGDMCSCMLGLWPDDKPFLRRVWAHRIEGEGNELSGHRTGNVNILAGEQVARKDPEFNGDPVEAITRLSREIGLVGDVWPVSRQSAHLILHYEDGTTEVGEANLDLYRPDKPKLSRIELDRKLEICPQAEQAILNAKAIVIGPGDTHANTASIFSVDGVQEAVRKSPAITVLPINLMTKYSETRDYPASRYIDTLLEYGIGRDTVDVVLVNIGPVPRSVQKKYWKEEKAVPVFVDEDELKKRRVKVVTYGNFLSPSDLANQVVRHDPVELGNQIVRLIGVR